MKDRQQDPSLEHLQDEKKIEEARKLISELGKKATSAEKKEEEKAHEKKLDSKEIPTLLRESSRAIMRHPSQAVLDQLWCIHQSLKKNFGKQSEEAISWLLGGSSMNARGGFSPILDEKGKELKTAAAQFKDFLNGDEGELKIMLKKTPQVFITRIETIATAIAYRSISGEWCEEPRYPWTREQKEISTIIDKLMRTMVLRIDDVQADRAPAFISKEQAASSSGILTGENNEISDDSEDEDEVAKRKKRYLEGRVHRKPIKPLKALHFVKRHDGETTWPYIAYQNGIPIRANTSGTAALTLAAIEGLLIDYDSKLQSWISDKDQFEALAAEIILAAYDRGDFHSHAESAVGILFYFLIRNYPGMRRAESVSNIILSPENALQYALDIMAKSADPEISNGKMSLKQAIETLTPCIMKTVGKNQYRQGALERKNTEYTLLHIRDCLSQLKTPDELKAFFKVNSLLMDAIVSGKNLAVIIEPLSPKLIKELFAILNIREIISTSDDFVDLMKNLTEHKSNVYSLIKDLLPSLIYRSSSRCLDVIMTLDVTQTKDLLINPKLELKYIIPTPDNFHKFISKVESEKRDIVWKSIEEYIKQTFLISPKGFKDFMRPLTPWLYHPVEISITSTIFNSVKKRLFIFLGTDNNFKNFNLIMTSSIFPEHQQEIFDYFKKKELKKVNSIEGLANIFQPLNTMQFKEILNNENVQLILRSPFKSLDEIFCLFKLMLGDPEKFASSAEIISYCRYGDSLIKQEIIYSILKHQLFKLIPLQVKSIQDSINLCMWLTYSELKEVCETKEITQCISSTINSMDDFILLTKKINQFDTFSLLLNMMVSKDFFLSPTVEAYSKLFESIANRNSSFFSIVFDTVKDFLTRFITAKNYPLLRDIFKKDLTLVSLKRFDEHILQSFTRSIDDFVNHVPILNSMIENKICSLRDVVTSLNDAKTDSKKIIEKLESKNISSLYHKAPPSDLLCMLALNSGNIVIVNAYISYVDSIKKVIPDEIIQFAKENKSYVSHLLLQFNAKHKAPLPKSS